jgi:hypothetical protein
MYRRAIEDFDRLKALRDEMPNEPNHLIQPEPADEVIPLEELNPDLKNWPEPDQPAPMPPSPAPRTGGHFSVSELTKDGPFVISGSPVRKVSPPASEVLPNEPKPAADRPENPGLTASSPAPRDPDGREPSPSPAA